MHSNSDINNLSHPTIAVEHAHPSLTLALYRDEDSEAEEEREEEPEEEEEPLASPRSLLRAFCIVAMVSWMEVLLLLKAVSLILTFLRADLMVFISS